MHHVKLNLTPSIVAACAACLICLVGLTPVAAQVAPPADESARLVAEVATVDGVITDADGDAFTIKADDGSTQSFTVNVDTLYTQDGIASTKEKTLKVGNKVSVTHKGQVALTVTAD
jgi:hypothetical protein